MGLKIVISSSRFADEKKAVIEELEQRDNALAMLGNSSKRIEYIYDCEKESTVFGKLPKQDVINRYVISGCDWFILLAPIGHVGDKTAGEARAAYEAVMQDKGPVFSLFYCRNPFGTSDAVAYREALERHNCPKRDTDVALPALQQLIKDLYGQESEHYMAEYEYTEHYSSLAHSVSAQFDMLIQENAFRAFRIEGLAVKGGEAEARDLYYDPNRALEVNGFNKSLYRRRSGVDERLAALVSGGSRMVAVTGLPGSGKSRAVYEYVTHQLAHENVILMNRGNLNDVIGRMKLAADLKARKPHLSAGQGTQQRLYLVADQVRDLFEGAGIPAQDIVFFFGQVLGHKNYTFICTSIGSAYDSFLLACPGVKNLFDSNVHLCAKLEIPPIGKGEEDTNFVNWLRLHYEKTKGGKTVADYIPRLNDYVEHIIRQLTDIGDPVQGLYVSHFLRACQLISVFRYSLPLCLVVMLVRQRCKDTPQMEFTGHIRRCIDYLEKNNAVWISRAINDNLFNYDLIQTYDDEKMKTIVPPDITFTVNELVWEELLLRDAALETGKRQFYCWNDPCETVNAVSWFFATFPTVRTLVRIVPRIPQTDCYRACINACMERVEEWIEQFAPDSLSDADREDMTNLYNLMIGRAEDRWTVDRLVDDMKDRGLQPNESTVGEMIRFSKAGQEAYTQHDIEDFQAENGISDNIYSVWRKLEYFTGTFAGAMAFLQQDAVVHTVDRTRTVGDLFGIDYFSLRRIYGTLARMCATEDDIHALVRYADDRYRVALRLADAENDDRTLRNIIRKDLVRLFEVDKNTLNGIRDADAAKALLKSYVDRLFQLNSSVLYALIERASHNRPMQELLQACLEEGKGVWASLKANNREMAYVGLVQTSKDFATSYAFYKAWKGGSGRHNPQMFAICLENCQRHEYKEAVQAFCRLEEEMGGPDRVSLILYNQMLKISPSLDDAMVFVKKLKSVDDYTLSNLLGIIDEAKDDAGNLNPKRFVFAYELINMPLFARLRCDIHVMAMMYKMAGSRKHERYLYHLIDHDLPENEAVGLKKLIAASRQINSILIRKRYRSLEVAFKLLEVYRKKHLAAMAHGEKMAQDCYSALCGKIASCKDPDKRNEAFKRWDALIEADRDVLEIDEFFYATLYRFRKPHALIDGKGEVSAEFRRDMESVRVTKWYIFGNIMSTMQTVGFGFEQIWKMYVYYRDTFVAGKKEKGLYPSWYMYKKLDGAAAGNAEWQERVNTEKDRFGFGRQHVHADSSIFIHRKLKTARTYRAVLQMLKDEIESGYLMPCVLNTAMGCIIKLMKCAGEEQQQACYAAVLDFLHRNGLIPGALTSLTYSRLLMLAPGFGEKQEWLFPQGEEPMHEVYLGTVATDFTIGSSDIGITRRYFDLWLGIYKDVGLLLDSNFDTLGVYLRIEMENERDGYLERVLEVLRLFVRHRHPLSGRTFRNRLWTELSEKLLAAFPDCAAIVDKVVIGK